MPEPDWVRRVYEPPYETPHNVVLVNLFIVRALAEIHQTRAKQPVSIGDPDEDGFHVVFGMTSERIIVYTPE